jgi:hypothetical protein
MPKWMQELTKSHPDLFNNTGGNDVEELMSGNAALIQINAPLALIQVAVESQISLLERLHACGLI